MSRIPRRVALLSLAAALALGLPAHAESVRVPGTGVRLAPPPGFTRADQFAGFQDAERGASIMITEIPGPASEVKQGMTRKGLASRGMKLIESRTVTAGGEEALLLHVSQSAGGVDFLKWILVGGSAERAVTVVGAFPVGTDLSDPIRMSVLSATWSESRRDDRFEGLPFRVDPTPEMRLADRMGNLLVLTESGTIAPGNPNMAMLVVGNSIGDAEIGGDLERFSRERLAQTKRLTKIRTRSGGAVAIDSLAGYELIGEGTDPENGRSVGVYQLLLADGKSYYIAQGLVVSARLTKLLPVFRRVTRSFRRTPEMGRPRITQ